jgi:hypothetical protein
VKLKAQFDSPVKCGLCYVMDADIDEFEESEMRKDGVNIIKKLK